MDLTIYSVSADLNVLNGIYNGVAMICNNQASYIWGFAMMAAVWRLVQTIGQTMVSNTQTALAALGNGTPSAFVPLFLAMLLTNPGFQSKVTLESTINGQVEQVDNVPMVVTLVPSIASSVSMDVGQFIETAFGNVNSEYSPISATGNGFINPLKLMLTARSAITRLSGIDVEINNIVETCIAGQQPVDYAVINAQVLNAGNTGATSSQVVQVSDSTSSPTSIGALLGKAGENTTTKVYGIDNTGLNYTCFDAANIVAQDISNALNSVEFGRVVTGSTSGMDAPNPRYAPTLQDMQTQFGATRLLAMNVAGGVDQTNAEMINLLMSEVVNDNLNCLQAEGVSKASCLASMTQGNEIERVNLASAANANQMLKYAGQFGNMLIALIIGLAPIAIMFMMFTGTKFGKSALVLVHLMVWPLLVMNVGAVLINSIIYTNVSQFMAALAQNGFLSQAVMAELYRQLSLQIGTAANLMGSLPVLMSTIFGLGTTAALTSVASSFAPKDTETASQVAPKLLNGGELLQRKAIGEISPSAAGAAALSLAGQQRSNLNASFGEIANKLGKDLSVNKTDEQRYLTSKAFVESITGSNAKTSRFTSGLTEGVRETFLKSQAETETSDQSASSATKNAVSRDKRLSVDAHAGIGGGVGTNSGLNVTGSIGVGTSRGRTDSSTVESGRTNSYSLADTARTALDKAKEYAISHGSSKDEIRTIENARRQVDDYTTSRSRMESVVDSANTGGSLLNRLVAHTATLTGVDYALHAKANSDFNKYEIIQGGGFERNKEASPYLEKARSNVGRLTDTVVGSSVAQNALVRNRAAAMMIADQNLSMDARIAAARYLDGQVSSMTGFNVGTDNLPKTVPTATPSFTPVDTNDPHFRKFDNGKKVAEGGTVPSANPRSPRGHPVLLPSRPHSSPTSAEVDGDGIPVTKEKQAFAAKFKANKEQVENDVEHDVAFASKNAGKWLDREPYGTSPAARVGKNANHSEKK